MGAVGISYTTQYGVRKGLHKGFEERLEGGEEANQTDGEKNIPGTAELCPQAQSCLVSKETGEAGKRRGRYSQRGIWGLTVEGLVDCCKDWFSL